MVTKKNEAAGRRGRLPAHAKQERVGQVLDAALRVIAANGYERATLRDIAVEAGASKETLYAWFGSREGLVTALIETNADHTATRLANALRADDSAPATARDTLTGYAAGLLTLLTSDASVALNRAALTSPELAHVLLTSGRHRIGPIVESYLSRLHHQGLIHAPDPDLAYRTLYGLVVRDTQIRVLLGEAAPTRGQIIRHAEAAVAGFWTLHHGAE